MGGNCKQIRSLHSIERIKICLRVRHPVGKGATLVRKLLSQSDLRQRSSVSLNSPLVVIVVKVLDYSTTFLTIDYRAIFV